MSLFGGFYAMVATLDQKFVQASIAIFVSCVLDALDGRVARMTNSTSRFGVEYDSLADVIALRRPGLLAYMWALKGTGGSVLAAFLYVAAVLCALRASTCRRTRSRRSSFSASHPCGGGRHSRQCAFLRGTEPAARSEEVFAPILMYALAFLMVSGVRYNSLKESGAFRSRHFEAVVAVNPAFCHCGHRTGHHALRPHHSLYAFGPR